MKFNFIRVIIAIFLISLFLTLLGLSSLLLTANICFNRAQKYDTIYLWDKAEINYQKAVKLMPFCAEYQASYGEFLVKISRYNQNGFKLLDKAAKLYQNALGQNPLCAEYWVELGSIQLKKFSIKNNPGYLKSAIEYFKQAVKNDPEGGKIAENISYSAAQFLAFFNKADAKWILDQVKKTMAVKYPNDNYLYAMIWKQSSDITLLQRLAEIRWHAQQNLPEWKENLDPNLSSPSPNEWKGKVGDKLHPQGEMYWSGTMHRLIDIPKQPRKIFIQAKGSSAYGVGPFMVISLDGKEIGSAFVQNTEFKDYVFSLEPGMKSGNKVISVTFTNDCANDKEDRNLYIGDVRVIPAETQGN